MRQFLNLMETYVGLPAAEQRLADARETYEDAVHAYREAKTDEEITHRQEEREVAYGRLEAAREEVRALKGEPLEEAKKRKRKRKPKYVYSAPRTWGLPFAYGNYGGDAGGGDCGGGDGGGGE